MGRELGRISGPLLSENLLRNGNDLVFDTDLLYLNVSTKQIGINTLGPSRDLTIPNGIDSTNLLVDTESDIANFVITTNQIQNPITTITISPNQSNPVITATSVGTSLLNFGGNTIKNATNGSNIEFTPSGTGVTEFNGSANVYGNLHATGNITWDGNVTLGNASTDRITFDADVGSDILPNVNNTWSLGSSSLSWSNVWTDTFSATTSSIISSLAVTTANIGNFTVTGNAINNATNDITFGTSGTGNIRINNVAYITGSTFTTYTSTLNSGFSFSSTGNGYVKFNGATGVVVPVGTTQNYPNAPVLGALRYSTELNQGEIYSGSAWTPVGGTSAVLTTAEVNDAMYAWDLILG